MLNIEFVRNFTLLNVHFKLICKNEIVQLLFIEKSEQSNYISRLLLNSHRQPV